MTKVKPLASIKISVLPVTSGSGYIISPPRFNITVNPRNIENPKRIPDVMINAKLLVVMAKKNIPVLIIPKIKVFLNRPSSQIITCNITKSCDKLVLRIFVSKISTN